MVLQVLLLSTGVIGRRIKLDALKEAVPKLAASLGSSVEDAGHAAVAITTTDLVSKSAALEVQHSSCHIALLHISAAHKQLPCFLDNTLPPYDLQNYSKHSLHTIYHSQQKKKLLSNLPLW